MTVDTVAADPQFVRFRFWRGLALAAAGLFLLPAFAAPALAGTHRAAHGLPLAAPLHVSSIVLDAETGKIVSENDADRPNYPASLTKMMTLYLLFQAIEQGKVSPEDSFTVSLHAARQAPSKLGLRPGETITVRNLILAIVTHSANDAAVTVAENMAGSEEAFAAQMTAKARALGMNATTFLNASGLPNPGQMSTPRDLARLARALWHDFPKEYAFFATDEFTYKTAIYETHNHLMQSFAGMDGIKTGYIHASGFNLAASAVRDGRRLFGVIMGGASAHGRDLEMASLLDDAFAGRTGEVRMASASDEETIPHDSLAGRAATTLSALNPVARAEAATLPAPGGAKHKARRIAENSRDWSIQVGAFANREAAEAAAANAAARLGLKGKVAAVLPPEHSDKEQVYRARIAGFTAAEADKACRALHAKLSTQKLCAVIPPAMRTAALAPNRAPVTAPKLAPATAPAPSAAGNQ